MVAQVSDDQGAAREGAGEGRRVWVKICGARSVEDAEVAAQAGADAVGLNLWPEAARWAPRARVEAICARLAARWPQVERVGVSVNAWEDAGAADADGRALGLSVHQLHGDEPAALVRGLCARGWLVIKALRLGRGDALDAVVAQIDALVEAGQGRCRVLVDARVSGHYGGTGARIDPALTRALLARRPVIVAGGLTPANVADVVALAPLSARLDRPGLLGVDVASGVESAPGRHDPAQVRAFIHAARAV